MKTAPLLLALSLLATLPALAQGDNFGAIKATTKFRPDGTKASTVVDTEQRTAVETITDGRDKVLRKTTFLLDERNLAIGAIHYDAVGTIRYKETYQRDTVGHVVETKFSGADGRSLGRRVFNFNGEKVTGVEDYDATGNLIPAKAPTTAARPDKKKK